MPTLRRRGVAAVLVAVLTAGCTAPAAPPDGASPDGASPGSAPAGSPGTPAGSPGTSSGGAPPAGTATRRTGPDHVVVVIFENKAYRQVAGAASAAYLNRLAATGVLFQRYSAVAHPSQPNYLALFSGSTQQLRSDRCPLAYPRVPNLASQLRAVGLSFTGYAEGLPRAGYTGCSAGRYARKHAPWVNFPGAPAGQPLSAFPRDFSTLPTVSFVIPDLCHDMHDCSVRTGDDWARANLEPYRAWAQTHDSLLVVTFDEDDHPGAGSTHPGDGREPANHIFTAVTGAGVRPGRYAEPVDHYRLLRTIESWYGLPALGVAAHRAPVPGLWP